MEQIRENIFVETDFLGCNPGFVVTSQGIVMVDTPQKPSQAHEWGKEIQGHGDVRYIIITDHHVDHVLGSRFFNGDVVTHEGTMKQLTAEGRLRFSKEWLRFVEPESEPAIESYEIRLPTITYSHKMSLFVGEEVFELYHICGHTGYETIVYLPSQKVLFTGDNVCTVGIPTLRESYPRKWFEALSFMEDLDFTTLVPGHGKIGTKESLRTFRNEFQALCDEVQERIARGCTRDEVIGQVSYEDHVHAEYPPSEKFALHVKMSIGRLYDEFTGAR